MRFVDMLPESFVESDFVANQRLKYEASRKRRVIVNAIAITTGVAIAAVATTTVVVVGKILLSRVPVLPTGINDAVRVDLSSIVELDHLKSMIDNCTAASIIHVQEGAILFLEK